MVESHTVSSKFIKNYFYYYSIVSETFFTFLSRSFAVIQNDLVGIFQPGAGQNTRDNLPHFRIKTSSIKKLTLESPAWICG